MTSLAESVRESVAAMSWLTPSDQAAVELAVQYAEMIDTAAALGPKALASALYLGPHLLNTLRALGGAPADRKALGVEEKVRGNLANLRALNGGRSRSA